MVTYGAETGICTVDTLPSDAVERRGTAAFAYHSIMLHSCRGRGGGGEGGRVGGREGGKEGGGEKGTHHCKQSHMHVYMFILY